MELGFIKNTIDFCFSVSNSIKWWIETILLLVILTDNDSVSLLDLYVPWEL